MDRSADLVLEARDGVGEGPVWDGARSCLWWVDIEGRRLHSYEPDGGRHVAVATPGRVGSFALRKDGGLVAAMEHALGLLDPATGAFSALAEPEADRVGNRFNDGRCDRRGRFLAGSMSLDQSWPGGALWRLDPDRRVAEVASGVTIANGLAWSPDGRTMWWADSVTARIWRFAYDLDTGQAFDRRLWLQHPPDGPLGLPDGAAMDSEGCYWSARYLGGRVIRFTPDGRVDCEIFLPCRRVTMCAFGGADLRTLYITTARDGADAGELSAEPLAGGLFAADAGVAGLPEPRWAG
jgi:L-arabinonolactonase